MGSVVFLFYLLAFAALGGAPERAAASRGKGGDGRQTATLACGDLDRHPKMTVYLLAPRTGRECALWIATVVVASVAEEAAYRGVGMSILWYSLGSPWIAALISATAFALAHSTQGFKSGAVIFAIALVMHGLVAFTGTLVLAMLVHATYDFIAGYRISREALQYDREAAHALDRI